MYQSSSESSIEHGNFPSVINLYAIGENSPVDQSPVRVPAKASSSSQTYTAQAAALDAQSDPFLALASSKSYPQSQYNDDEVSYASSSTYSASPSSATSSGVNIPPMAPVTIPVNPPMTYIAPHDRQGSCGSPPSSDSDSDCESTPRPRRRESTTSTSTTSSEETRPIAFKPRVWKPGASSAASAASSSSSAAAAVGGGVVGAAAAAAAAAGKKALLSSASPASLSHRTQLNIVGSPSPSSNTVSSGGSVPGRHSLISQFSANTGRIETTLAETIVESIALQCTGVADSGISNTSPETQSSTEFHSTHQRSLETVTAPLSLAAGACAGILKPNRDFTTQHNLMQAAFKASLCKLLSSFYALCIVALGLLMPAAELLSDSVSLALFESFYMYQYTMSIIFLMYVYALTLRSEKIGRSRRRPRCGDTAAFLQPKQQQQQQQLRRLFAPVFGRGSGACVYLRVGCVVFGFASMIRDGLTFAAIVQHGSNVSVCSSPLLAARPALALVFTFLQINFLFLNANMCVHQHACLSRFGLAQLMSTNVCVWLRTVARDSVAGLLAHTSSSSSSFSTSFSSSSYPSSFLPFFSSAFSSFISRLFFHLLCLSFSPLLLSPSRLSADQSLVTKS